MSSYNPTTNTWSNPDLGGATYDTFAGANGARTRHESHQTEKYANWVKSTMVRPLMDLMGIRYQVVLGFNIGRLTLKRSIGVCGMCAYTGCMKAAHAVILAVSFFENAATDTTYFYTRAFKNESVEAPHSECACDWSGGAPRPAFLGTLLAPTRAATQSTPPSRYILPRLPVLDIRLSPEGIHYPRPTGEV